MGNWGKFPGTQLQHGKCASGKLSHLSLLAKRRSAAPGRFVVAAREFAPAASDGQQAVKYPSRMLELR